MRTLIGGLTPTSINGQVVYRTQFGHLTTAIARNWAKRIEEHGRWGKERRIVTTNSFISHQEEYFRGLWLIIDEFNRAPIDLALGDALTALGSGNDGVLRVPTDDGLKDLPIPKDFRIIGTLNSFDRNYLNQISEALKRRFSFIEILPPNRTQRFAEQQIVLRKAFESVEQIGIVEKVTINDNPQWVYKELDGRQVALYSTEGVWLERTLPNVFELARSIVEIVRIYRQLGTAQFITLMKSTFIAIFSDPSRLAVGIEALDNALCDTIADQLQVLLPDELEVLYQYVKRSSDDAFVEKYNSELGKLAQRRRNAQLEALGRVVDDNGQEILTEDEIGQIVPQAELRVAREKLVKIFRLGEGTFYPLPQFARRLRVFKAERGL